MSERQYYEFIAVDRPLSSKKQEALRRVSSRAEITATRFVNTYDWGDLRADCGKLVEQYFDAHLHVNSLGPPRLILRLPADRLDAKVARDYFVAGVVRTKRAGQHVLVDVVREDEGDEYYGDFDVEELPLSSLIALRAELLGGDLRFAYLCWLLAVQNELVEDAATEPRVPGGLGALTAAQQAFVDLFGIDEDLVATAARTSAPPDADEDALRAWVASRPTREKDRWLARALDEPGLALGTELRGAFRRQQELPAFRGRTVAELRASAAEARDARQLAQKRARERKKRAAEAATNARLDVLAADVPGTWVRVEAGIEAREYDAAVALALELRELAARDGTMPSFVELFKAMKKRQIKRQPFFNRWSRATTP